VLAESRGLEKFGRLSNVCHIKIFLRAVALNSTERWNGRGRGKVGASNRPFVQYQPRNINKFSATIGGAFYVGAMFSLKSENENKV
jgi:hypothetical protein